ncbi:MAG: D-sedoheptulose-7-phosphate isomerase [Peptoanaerobacter stomatis]|uniref:D-sedoheptulose-7-phosphate isomerase n=1 Tax=Peptoanaerobacter stomatis TaxID=796937 RepID=UPI003F9FE770
MKTAVVKIIDNLIERYPSLDICRKDILLSVEMLINCYKNKNKLLICGNGGSASDSQHIAGELMKSFRLKRNIPIEIQKQIEDTFPQNSSYYIENLEQTLTAISLVGETSLITAYSNDKAPDLIFAQQIYGLGNTGDILFAISTSGNSKNVLYACEIAQIKGMKVIGLTGQSGGKMSDICDILIKTPEAETYKIQEYHLPIYHAICLALEEEFFGKGII